jgi:uncharacterized protein (TIGR00645 family)
MNGRFKSILRTVLLGSRWGMAPLCAGLVVALLIVLAQFFRELAQVIVGFAAMDSAEVMLAVLKLIDLVLIANLVLMIIGAGVEIFLPASASAEDGSPQGPDIVDFSMLKLKLFASISAIAAIYLLERFINIHPMDKSDILWEIVILISFVVSGVLLALMDRLSSERR